MCLYHNTNNIVVFAGEIGLFFSPLISNILNYCCINLIMRK